MKKVVVAIESIVNPAEDYYLISLQPKEDFHWEAGDFAIFEFDGLDLEGGNKRAFSIASCPEEGKILLGIRGREEMSAFKERLVHMKAGEELMMRGPMGHFHLKDEKTPIIFMAGGVGITPIRALMKELKEDVRRKINLLYSSTKYFLFMEEFKDYAQNNSSISIYECASIEATQQTAKELMQVYGDKAYYYISGPKAFVDFLEENLLKNDIPKEQIIKDSFTGY